MREKWRAAFYLGLGAVTASLIGIEIDQYLLEPGFKIAGMCALTTSGKIGERMFGENK